MNDLSPRFRFSIRYMLAWTFLCAIIAAAARMLDAPLISKVVIVVYFLLFATYFFARGPMLTVELRQLADRARRLKSDRAELAEDAARRKREHEQQRAEP